MNSPQNSKSRLARSFLDVSSELLKTDEPETFLAHLGWHRAFDWEDLYKSTRVLIFAEAGAGKTHECRAEQSARWDTGEPAFFVELAELARNNLCDLLGPDEQVRFDAWKSTSTGTATFFLDSVDELKLTQGSFETALKRLAKELGGKLGQTRIVITTRPVSVDRALIEQHLTVPQEKEDLPSEEAFADIAMNRPRTPKSDQHAAPTIRHVALMPLSNEQISEMAVLQGVTDVDALLNGIRQRNAEEFARRPQDLIDLCTDWKDHHRIRTHNEQVEYNITIKLKPRTSTEGREKELVALTAEKAWEGASRMALAALLTRKLTLRHSAEADSNNELGAALDPAKILTDWSKDERTTLLERALFGFASYGRVRFHHRSVIEFLAAKRLQQRIDKGMGIRAVKRLLFAENAQGVRVVKPTMRPVAAWLAATQPAIFSEVRDREPEVLLNHADPESLPADRRVDALRAYVEKHGQGKWRGLHVPRIQVHRFASNELGPEVLRAWKSGIENPEVRALLLEIIEAGPIQAGADIAHATVLSHISEHEERIHALDALVQLADPRLDEVTNAMVMENKIWTNRLLTSCIPRLFPDHIRVDRLSTLLARTTQKKNEVNWLSYQWIPLIAARPISISLLEALRHELMQLVSDGINWKEHHRHIRSPRQHLVTPLAAICLRQIKASQFTPKVVESSALALRLCKNDHRARDEDPVSALRQALANAPAHVRSMTFWESDAFNQRCGSGEPKDNAWGRFFDAHESGVFCLNPQQDLSWVLANLADPTGPMAKRAVMLEAALYCIRHPVNEWRPAVQALKNHVLDAPELMAAIDVYLKPASVKAADRHFQIRDQKRKQQEERREAKNRASWVLLYRQVANEPEKAFAPDQAEHTAWALWEAMRMSDHQHGSSSWTRDFIEKYFGKQAADQLRTAMCGTWRKERPTLRSERPASEENQFPMVWDMGLASIAAEAEDVNWAAKLSADEAKLAARYAPIELNDFPPWLESLAKCHPESVESVLWPELASDLDEIATNNVHRVFLQSVLRATKTVAGLFLPKLRLWLDINHQRIRDGEDRVLVTERLRWVIEILLAHGTRQDREHISATAKNQLDTGTDSELTQVWLPVLMQLNPALGIDMLVKQLNAVPPTADGPGVRWVSRLFGERHFETDIGPRLPNFTPSQLLTLVRLAERHVNPKDDIKHDGVFTPGPRDNAEDGRRALLNALLNAEGPDAWEAKFELANDPLFTDHHDRLVMLSREKAAEELDTTALTETQVVALGRTGEAPPITRDDMFALMMDRLDDMEELLLRDDSPREAWAGITAERVMRREMTRVLRDASRNSYTVDQEGVTADEKETDIRLRATASMQQAVIELKLGDGRSGRDLRDTIQHQLFTRYMASETCRVGCLLVTVNADRHWDHPDSGESLDVAGLQTMLTSEAERIASAMGGQICLTARVLDLRPRLATEKKTTAVTTKKPRKAKAQPAGKA